MNEDLVETTIIRLDEGEKIPVNLDIFDGMICLGGPMDTWMEEQYPWMIDEKNKIKEFVLNNQKPYPVSYTHLRAHETCADLVCRLLLEKKK